jgi:hypothetical protein
MSLSSRFVAIGPELEAIADVHELHGDADAIAGAPHTALKHGRDAQFLGDAAQVLAAIAKRERRRAGSDTKPRQLCQRVEDLFGDAVAEPVLVLLGAEIGERQHGDGGAGSGWRGFRCRRAGCAGADLLDRFSEVRDEIRREPLGELVVNPSRVPVIPRFCFTPDREGLVHPSELRVDGRTRHRRHGEARHVDAIEDLQRLRIIATAKRVDDEWHPVDA